MFRINYTLLEDLRAEFGKNIEMFPLKEVSYPENRKFLCYSVSGFSCLWDDLQKYLLRKKDMYCVSLENLIYHLVKVDSFKELQDIASLIRERVLEMCPCSLSVIGFIEIIVSEVYKYCEEKESSNDH